MPLDLRHRRMGYFQDTPVPYAALDEIAAAILIYRRVLELGIGMELPL